MHQKKKKGSEYKHSLFMEKLHEYEELKNYSLFLFYNENKKGLDTAKKSFMKYQRNKGMEYRFQNSR